MSKISAAITAVGAYVPEYVLTNQILETMVDTNDEWITSRTGIKERRILKEEGKGTSFLAINAAQDLINKRGIDPKDIELVIVATATPDMKAASTAAFTATQIGASNAFSFDLEAACSSFLFGMSTAAKYIESGRYKNVLLIGADKNSSMINYEDRATCIIFGDGGSGREYLQATYGGSSYPSTVEAIEKGQHYVFQDGKTVFKNAVFNMADVVVKILERNNLKKDNLAWLAAHQANKRIIDATANRIALDENKVMMNIQKYGNTTSATLPLLLHDYENQLKKGDNLIFAAFGGGFTWGSIYLKWAYNS
jgi:3-oxoacyl-[acyl-carrier-protein] synthase-3